MEHILNHNLKLIMRSNRFNPSSAKILSGVNLVPRSHSVTGNVRSGKVRFRACSVPARPEIRAFASLRMVVLSVVILGDFAE